MRRILVVDDEPDVEVLFRQQFRRDLRAGRFTASRHYLLAALRLHPAQPVDLLCLLVALARFHPPFITRWVGRVSQ